LRSLFWWRPPYLSRRVIVHQVSDTSASVSGVVWESRGAYITLKDAYLLRSEPQGAPPLKIDGEATFHQSQIAWVQVP